MPNNWFKKIRIGILKFFREIKKEPIKTELSDEEIAELKKKKRQIAAAKNKVSKKHLIKAIGSGNAAIMFLMLAFLGLIVGVRFGALTDFGRQQIVSTFNGMKLGRVGNLNIEGLEGDIFTKFKLRYASISDSQGIWIEGRNFNAEWESLALLRGLILINSAEAKGIRIYRRPILTPRTKFLKRYLVALRIEKAKSPIESFEGFSVVRGIGGAAARIELHHNKDFKLNAKLISIRRFSDGASVDLETHDGVPVYSFISANESSGGAIAGALGLNPSQSLLINSRLWAKSNEGSIDTIGLSGGNKFADIKGKWNKEGGAINGSIDFSSSNLTRQLSKMFGQNVGLQSDWTLIDGISPKKIYNANLALNGNNASAKISGPLDFKAKRSTAPLNVNFNIQSITDFLQSSSIRGAAANSSGKLDITKTGAIYSGNYQLNSVGFGSMALNQINGPIDIIHENGQSEIKLNFFGAGGTAQSMLSRALGANPRGTFNATRFNDGRFFINLIEIYGHAFNLKGNGSRNLLGALELNGKAEMNVAPVIGRNYTGAIDIDFNAKHHASGGETILKAISKGRNLHNNNSLLDSILGNSQKLEAMFVIAKNGVSIKDIKLLMPDIDARGSSISLSGPIATLGGDIKIGSRIMKVAKLDGTTKGNWGFAYNKANSKVSLGFDLVGESITSNNREIDKLLTASPKIKGTIGFRDMGAQLTDGQITSAKLNSIVKGDISNLTGFNLNLDWKILGPNTFGRLEIGGNLAGTGSISGPLGAPTLSLKSNIDEVNLGFAKLKATDFAAQMQIGQNPFQAMLSFNGNSDYGRISGDGTLVNVPNGMEVRGIKIDGAGIVGRGSARIFKNRDPSADIAFIIGQGAILQSGNLNGRLLLAQNGNQTIANVLASGNGFRFRGQDTIFSSLNISGNGALSNLNLDTRFATSGAFPISFIGTTHIAGQNNIYGVEINGRGVLDGRNFAISEPIRIGFEEGKQSAKGVINFSNAASVNQGYLNFDLAKNHQGVQNHIKAQNLALTLLGRDLVGTFSGEIDLNGRSNQLRGIMFGELKDARTRGLNNNLALNGNINARLSDNELAVDLKASNAQGLVIDTNAKLPVTSSAAPLRLAIERTKPISGDFDVKGEIRPLADLVFAGERILSGNINSVGNFGGTLNAPKLIGNFKLDKGSFRESSIGLNLNNLNLSGRTDGDKLIVSNFSANDNGRGTINGQGEIQISGGGNSSFSINTRRFRLVDSETTKIDATTSLVLASVANQRAKLSGNVNIDFAQFSPRALSGNRIVNIEVEEINRPTSQTNLTINSTQSNTAQSVRRNQENVELDVNINAARGIFVRGSGLNLELSLDAKAKGNLSAPNLTGLAKVYRGEYEYGGRSFQFDDNGTIILSSNPNHIRLNLVAERQDNNFTAKIAINGTAADPKIRLTSTPELPQDEILAQVIFGRSRAQLTPLETVQLAANLANLAAGGGFDVISNLRDITRLDRLVFSNTATGEVSVAGGKYLGRDLYLELISEGTQGISSRVEWRPTKSTAIISRLGAEGDARISIRWRRDIK